MDQSRHWTDAGSGWRDVSRPRANPVSGDSPSPRTGVRKRREFSDKLRRVVEGEIIPRLLLTHTSLEWAALNAGSLRAEGDDVAQFLPLLLANDPAECLSFIGQLRARGVTLESIFLDLMAPAARQLGDMWIDDRCDFLQVSLSLANLRQLLHELSLGYGRDTTGPQATRSVILAAAPGESHTFGIAMVETFFRGAGWQVAMTEGDHTRRLLARVGEESFGLAGFSLSSERNAEALGLLIHQVRRASRNPHIGILVGGPLLAEQPEYVVLVGADAMAANAAGAVAVAQNLLDLRTCSC